MGKKKKGHEKEPNHERWLVSYADFITLLFAVFVTLYAMSQTDKKKVEEVIASLRESFGYSKTSPASKPNVIDAGSINIIPSLESRVAPPPKKTGRSGKTHAEEVDFKAIKAAIEAYLLKNGAQEKVSVEINRRGLVVSLKEAGFFNSGSATVRQDSTQLLAKVAEALNNFTNPIRVEGHTDNMPISSYNFPSNWELSTARATNIVQYFIRQYNYEPASISATGYGEHRPAADNGTSEGRSKNRRVDIVLLSHDGERGEP
ncbi:flagellar motor protein MotB [Geobacter sp. DSM 9736]|uniref:OmpA/MotB family protein n=1 Tax=Geobacter sp. DSM 9736 TaxID=1277350 RepID=UPI000B50DB23|nr:flagellar motor protein MotB [Geobacter sp. DSM 9736]SNB47021.1 chemotaxis protein MotB [Geobacter sp. DSM 9736]